MYRIALCDDDEREPACVKELLDKYREAKGQLDYSLEWFADAHALLRSMEQAGKPDLVLLDIYMPDKNGIAAAQEIRSLGSDVPIVFLTASTEHALNAYGVDAVQYLVKPLAQETFFHAMDTVLGLIQKAKESQLVLKTAHGIVRLQPDDIVYCESQKNYQMVYLAEEECRIRMTAEGIWGMLKPLSQFARCGRSFILNMNHIVSIKQEEIQMDNGRLVYLPKSRTAEFKKLYLSYYFE